MEALAIEPAARRRFARHRVHWPAILTLEGGQTLRGVARDYCVGGAYLAMDAGPDRRSLPGVGSRGRLELAPPGIAPARMTVEVRQTGGEGLGLMFLDAAEADTSRLLAEATRPPAPATAARPEAESLRAALRTQLERNFQHWGPLWLAALKQRLFRVAAEAPSSQQHRLMDVHQALQRDTEALLADVLRQVLARFDDPADRSGEPDTLLSAPLPASGEPELALVDNDVFEDFLAEADLASRVEAAHRNLLFRVNAMLVAALGAGFETGEGPLSPRALVRGLWSVVQRHTGEVAVRQMAQSLFNEMFVSRFGEFYADCARRLTEAGFTAEVAPRPLPRRAERAGAQAEPAGAGATSAGTGPEPAGAAAAAAAAASASPGPGGGAVGPAPAFATGPGWPTAVPVLAPAEEWPPAGAGAPLFERTQGLAGGQAAPAPTSWDAWPGPADLGLAQATALARLYARAGTARSGPAYHPPVASAPSAHSPGWAEVAGQAVARSAPSAEPPPTQGVAGTFVHDFLAALATDPRVGAAQRAALEGLRPVVEPAVAGDPAALTDPTHPVRRVASALSRLVWLEGEQAVAPCGLEVNALLERLACPEAAGPALFLEVARELEATLALQREAVSGASAELVSRHADALAQVQSRRRPEEVHGVLAEQVPAALAPWLERARRLAVGDEILRRQPRQADELLRLVWVGDGQRQFAFTDPAATRLHGMTLQELALQLMRGRIVPVTPADEPVAAALLSMVDAADARLQETIAVDPASGLWNEVGVLRELEGLPPRRHADGEPVDAQLARWRAVDARAADLTGFIEVLQAGLPAGTRCARLDDGDLLAYAPPGVGDTRQWMAAVRAVSDACELHPALPRIAVALRRFRPGAEPAQTALERLGLALAGGDPDRLRAPGPEELRAALAGQGPFSLVSDVTPIRAGSGPSDLPVALALVPRLLEGLAVDAGVVNTDAALARAWDHWMLAEAIARALAAGAESQTLWYVPVSDRAIDDPDFVDQVGARLLGSGLAPSRLMLELGLTHPDRHEALLNTVAGLRAFGLGVALRYRHGAGLTAALLRRAGVGCLHLPDWLCEPGQRSVERSLLVNSLIDLCRFIDVPSLAVVPAREAAGTELAELGVDWLWPQDEGGDGTVRLRARD